MVTASYSVDDEVIQALQLRELLLRNMVHVSAVGNVAESET